MPNFPLHPARFEGCAFYMEFLNGLLYIGQVVDIDANGSALAGGAQVFHRFACLGQVMLDARAVCRWHDLREFAFARRARD